MKKSLLALAVLGAFAGAASAQTNVTLYGIVDVGVQSYDADRATGADKTTRMISGGQSASRIGFRGTEDLGSGLKANFVLEQGFNADDGSASAGQFNRLAYVGLQGGFGSVVLGKQTHPLKDAHDAIDPFGAAGATGNIENIFYGGSTLATYTADGSGRPGNTIKYISPSIAGFSGKVSYTFGETTGATSANRNVGAGLSYANGPINVQFGVADGETAFGAAAAAENQAWFLGASYNFGVAKLHAAYADYETDPIAAAGVTSEGRNALIGVTVPFGASSIMASWARNDNRSAGVAGDADTDRLALMYTYDLSKRTNFYVGASIAKNDTGATLAAGSSAPQATTASGDPKQFNVGVRHRF